MQARVAFNAGEFAPEMVMRTDIDYYQRGCLTLENWELSQLGGLKRRRGMRKVALAHSENSRLMPYVYSYVDGEGLRFLIEADTDLIKVWSEDGRLIKAFRSSEEVPFTLDLAYLKHKQINAMMILTSPSSAPLVLTYEDDGTWTLKLFDFKFRPWRHLETHRNKPVVVNFREPLHYEVKFAEDEDENESRLYDGDVLRLTDYVDTQELKESSKALRESVDIVESLPATAKAGKRYAIKGESTIKYFSCIADFPKDSLVTGLDMPTNYTGNFLASEDLSEFDTVEPITGLSHYFAKNSGNTIPKGTKIAIEMGYWEYYTCIKDFSGAVDGKTDFKDYPVYFISGIPVGDVATCGGEWVFYCSGLWYGSYEVRRNYNSKLLSADWETRGESFSRNEAVSNTQISGSEIEEECYLRLFLTRSRWVNGTLEDGFPADSNGNRLIVRSYKHDTLLKCNFGGGKEPWVDISPIPIAPSVSREYYNWSWQAYSERYGYPYICERFNNRLLFASTKSQPQTVWFSKVDDINNFKAGTGEDAAIDLTMLTDTQNPICWLKPRKKQVMLGTGEGEHVIGTNSNSVAFSSSTAMIEEHGYVGSTNAAALGTSGQVLYIERGGGRVWSFAYSLEIDGWRSEDVTLFASHIAQEHGGFKRSSLVKKPDTTILYVLGDGQLALCTYNPMQEIKAWHRWTTDGQIMDVCGLANGSANDKIYLVVKRSDGNYIEVVDEQSGYNDNGRPYESVMVTTALNNALQAHVVKRNNPVVKAYFCHEFDLQKENLKVSTDGEIWWESEIPHGKVEKGWRSFISPKGWDYQQFVAFKVTGEQEFNISAIQA